MSQPDEDEFDEPEYMSSGRRGRRDFDGPSFERTGSDSRERGGLRRGRDKFDDGRRSNREDRRSDKRGKRGERDERNSRRDGEGFYVASEPREARRGRKSSEKGRGRSNRGGRRGR